MTVERMTQLVNEQLDRLDMRSPKFSLFAVAPQQNGRWWIEIEDRRKPVGPQQSQRLDLPNGPNTEEYVSEWLATELTRLRASN